MPRDGGTDEDDGVLLDLVLDADADRSYVACIDARTMEVRGRAYLPGVVPFDVHGEWVAAREG